MVRPQSLSSVIRSKPYSTMIYLLIYLVIAHCSAGLFLFKTLKPRLYPFEPAFSGIEDDYQRDETLRQNATVPNRQIDPKQWAWIVMVMSAFQNYYSSKTDFKTVCLGILITRSDVLTTCSCINDAMKNPPSGTRNKRSFENDEVADQKLSLMVKPKTTIVRWDEMMKTVTHVQYHESCTACNQSKSYNNLALLTVEIFNVIYGVIETIPRWYFKGHRKEVKGQGKIHRNCYIIAMDVVTPADNESRLVPTPMSRRKFNPWDFPSPVNDVGTSLIVGRSEVLYGTHELRYSGSPLMCDDDRDRTLPVGIYLGLACPSGADISKIKADCDEQQKDCSDCFPSPLEYLNEFSTEKCKDSNAFEIVLTFDNLEEWLDDNTFEIFDKIVVPHKKSRSVDQLPPSWIIFILIPIILLKELIF